MTTMQEFRNTRIAIIEAANEAYAQAVRMPEGTDGRLSAIVNALHLYDKAGVPKYENPNPRRPVWN